MDVMEIIKITVTSNSIKIVDKPAVITAGSVNAYRCDIEFADGDWNNLVKVALINDIAVQIAADSFVLPCLDTGAVSVGVYGYELDNDKLIMRLSPTPDELYISAGSYREDAEEQATPTPSVFEQYIEAMTDLSAYITTATINNNGHLIVTLSNGKTFDCGLAQGKKGDKGEPGKDGTDYVLTDTDKQEVADMIDYGQVANSIKNTVSGKAAVAKDISPLTHALTVSLSSDTVTGFSSVSVKKYGKNLINGNHITSNGNTFPVSLSAGTYVISVRNSDGSATGITFGSTFSANFKDANNAVVKSVSGQGKFVLTAEDAARITKLATACSVTIPDGVYRMYQLECGSAATSFEPYVEPQTVTANADGTVIGLTFMSPSITLMTDNSGVDISLTYNADTKKYIDNKFAELQAMVLEG